jgi:cytochrome P450
MGVPGKHIVRFTRDRMGYIRQIAGEYGDLAYVPLGPIGLAVVSHPDLVRDILITHGRNFVKGRGLQRTKRLLGNGLLTSEGEFHLRQRRLAQPAFHRERIASYASAMVRHADRAAHRWRDGMRVDMAQEMARVALAIAGETLFGADVEGEADEIREALTTILSMFNISILPFAEVLDHLPLPMTLRFNRARRRLDATIYRLIDERRASGEDTGDLLAMLMAARDEEGDGSGMSDEQLRDEAMTLLLAGHETTANALAWTWYLLARHPRVEERLRGELAAALGGRLPTAEDAARLPYTRAVLAESMRLYPPAWSIGHRNVEPQPLGDYLLPAGTLCIMPIFLVHRDPRWWTAPDEFRPERFLEPEHERPRFAYFPFGGGRRQCIGEHFAWLEGVMVMATLAQRWRAAYEGREPPVPEPLITLRPRDGLPMTLHATPTLGTATRSA